MWLRGGPCDRVVSIQEWSCNVGRSSDLLLTLRLSPGAPAICRAHLAEVPEIVLANEMLRRLPHAPDVQAGRPGTGLPLHNEVLVLPELSAEPTGGGRGSGY